MQAPSSPPPPDAQDPQGDLDLAYFLAGRRLYTSGRRALALVPVGKRVRVGRVGRGIARALARISGEEIALLEGAGRALTARGTPRRKTTGRHVAATTGAHPAAGEPGPGVRASTEPVRVSGVVDGVAIVTVPAEPDPWLAGTAIQRAGMEVENRFSWAIADLTGVFPENRQVIEMFDGVVLVALAGRVEDRELERIQGLVPPERAAGVLLVDLKDRGSGKDGQG